MTVSKQENSVTKISNATVPTIWGDYICHVYRDERDGIEHLAFVSGDVRTKEKVLVRLHSECITGDIFHSKKCDCGDQLDKAMTQIAQSDGVFIYLRGHEGRGIGIGAKIQAYALQEQGLDTVEANEELGLPVDSRDYGIAVHMLKDLGVLSVRLITNNTSKVQALEDGGIKVTERVALLSAVTPENSSYLRTKNLKLGHLIEGLDS